MIRRISVITSIAAILIIAFIIGCDKDDSKKVVLGKIISASECKSTKSTSTDTVFACAEYAYNSASGTLLIKHVNAIFNCCPGVFNCNTVIRNDTIIITESSSEASCHCMCFYDLDIEINGVKEQEYFIRFEEPHIGSQPPLQFDVQFLSQPVGSVCVVRDPYN